MPQYMGQDCDLQNSPNVMRLAVFRLEYLIVTVYHILNQIPKGSKKKLFEKGVNKFQLPIGMRGVQPEFFK